MKAFRLFGALLLATTAAALYAEAVVRHREENARFSIAVIDDTISASQKSDGKVLIINNVLWGESPISKSLPQVMLSSEDSTLIVPMKDNSFWIIDLKESFDKADVTGGLIGKIEGGVARGGYFDRTRAYWSLERNFGGGLICGTAMDHNDRIVRFFLDVFEGKVITNKGATDTVNTLNIRMVSAESDSETQFNILADSTLFKKLEDEHLSMKEE